MDKNSIIGIVLITLIIIGFSYLNRPSAEQIAAQKARQAEQALRDSLLNAGQSSQTAEGSDIAHTKSYQPELHSADSLVSDSAAQARRMADLYGAFAVAAKGDNSKTILENDLVALTIDNRGGRISNAILKKYDSQDGSPVTLFSSDESLFGFTLVTDNQRVVNSEDLYFIPQGIASDTAGNQTLVMRLLTTGEAYMDVIYTLPANDYMVSMNIAPHNMDSVMPYNMNSLTMHWSQHLRQQERGRQFEERYSRLAFKYHGDKDIEELSENKEDSETVSSRLQWIGFKDQFFSTVLIADTGFTAAELRSIPQKEGQYLKHYESKMVVPFDVTGNTPTRFRIYIGPNHYSTLSAYNDESLPKAERLQLQKLVPLGMKWYSWVNRWAIIPLFNFFSRYLSNYGLIILLMTLVIKLVIFPLTYKSYLSSAKMRVIKPQIDAINEKYPPEKMQERQQATMALYSKVGISPMSGCLPLLLQMPILIAVFSFFPTCIDLRGESFLWADDLSAYDSIFSWETYIPLITPYFGNHISLFCLLMTVTNIAYTYINMQNQGGGEQFAAMKWMMYLMPIFFMVFFNNYASGLSYYYFVSLLITIVQTTLFRLFIDDKKILEELNRKANSREKPKKSSFMERLEKMQREQQRRLREQAKRR